MANHHLPDNMLNHQVGFLDILGIAAGNRESMVGRPYNVGLDSANISKGDLAEKIKDHLPDFDISYIGEGKDPDQLPHGKFTGNCPSTI